MTHYLPDPTRHTDALEVRFGKGGGAPKGGGGVKAGQGQNRPQGDTSDSVDTGQGKVDSQGAGGSSYTDPSAWGQAADTVMKSVDDIVKRDKEGLADPCQSRGRYNQLLMSFIPRAMTTGAVNIAKVEAWKVEKARKIINELKGLPKRIKDAGYRSRFDALSPRLFRQAIPRTQPKGWLAKNPPRSQIAPWTAAAIGAPRKKMNRYLDLGNGIYLDRWFLPENRAGGRGPVRPFRGRFRGRAIARIWRDWFDEAGAGLTLPFPFPPGILIDGELAGMKARMQKLEERKQVLQDLVDRDEKLCVEEFPGAGTYVSQSEFREKQARAKADAEAARAEREEAKARAAEARERESQRAQAQPQQQTTNVYQSQGQSQQTGDVTQQTDVDVDVDQDDEVVVSDGPTDYEPLFGYTDALEGSAQDGWVHDLVGQAAAAVAAAHGSVVPPEHAADAAQAILDALHAQGDAIRMLQAGNAQLERARRGVAQGQFFRHRALTADAWKLAYATFDGATWEDGSPVEPQQVLPQIPGTYEGGGAVSTFGAKPQAQARVRVTIPSLDPILFPAAVALASGRVIEAADAIYEAAADVQNKVLQFKQLDAGVPLLPGDEIMRTLAQASLLPAGPGSGSVWTVGGQGMGSPEVADEPLSRMCDPAAIIGEEAMNDSLGAAPRKWLFRVPGIRNKAGEWVRPPLTFPVVATSKVKAQAVARQMLVTDRLPPYTKIERGAVVSGVGAFGGKLSYKARKELPPSAFLFPRERAYPVKVRRGGKLVKSPSHGRSARSYASRAYETGNMTRKKLKHVWKATNKLFGFPMDTLPSREAQGSAFGNAISNNYTWGKGEGDVDDPQVWPWTSAADRGARAFADANPGLRDEYQVDFMGATLGGMYEDGVKKLRRAFFAALSESAMAKIQKEPAKINGMFAFWLQHSMDIGAIKGQDKMVAELWLKKHAAQKAAAKAKAEEEGQEEPEPYVDPLLATAAKWAMESTPIIVYAPPPGAPSAQPAPVQIPAKKGAPRTLTPQERYKLMLQAKKGQQVQAHARQHGSMRTRMGESPIIPPTLHTDRLEDAFGQRGWQHGRRFLQQGPGKGSGGACGYGPDGQGFSGEGPWTDAADQGAQMFADDNPALDAEGDYGDDDEHGFGSVQSTDHEDWYVARTRRGWPTGGNTCFGEDAWSTIPPLEPVQPVVPAQSIPQQAAPGRDPSGQQPVSRLPQGRVMQTRGPQPGRTARYTPEHPEPTVPEARSDYYGDPYKAKAPQGSWAPKLPRYPGSVPTTPCTPAARQPGGWGSGSGTCDGPWYPGFGAAGAAMAGVPDKIGEVEALANAMDGTFGGSFGGVVDRLAGGFQKGS